MRVAFLTDEVLPGLGADTIQFINALSAVATAGVEVDLYLPLPPGHAALRDAVALESLLTELRAHYSAPCDFRLVPVPGDLRGPRLLTKLTSGTFTSKRSLSRAYDLIHTRTLLPSLAIMAAGQPLIFESYRPLTSQFAGARALFRALAPRRPFAGLVTHSAMVRDRFIQDGVPAEKVITLYNGFDATLLTREVSPAEARAALGWRDAPTVLYAGRIGRKKAVDLLADGARQVPKARWVFAGDSSSEEAAEIRRSCADLPNVDFPGYLKGESLNLALQAADVLLIPPSRRPLEQVGTTVMPIKIFGYLASGRPILAGALPDTMELLRHDENACLVEPDDVGALCNGVRRLLDDAPHRERLAGEARTLARSLTWDARGVRLRAFYEQRLTAFQRLTTSPQVEPESRRRP